MKNGYTDRLRIFELAQQQTLFIVDGKKKIPATAGSKNDFPSVVSKEPPYINFQISWALLERIAHGHTLHVNY